MARIRVTKEFAFEAAHMLEGYDGHCSQIHGHSYRLFVTIIGSPIEDPSNPKCGMVMDFGDLKRIVNKVVIEPFDHSFIIKRSETNSPLIDTLNNQYQRIVVVDYQPTCENMVSQFARRIAEHLPSGVSLHNIRLYETAQSYAEWDAADNI